MNSKNATGKQTPQKEPRVTFTKGIRLTEDELAHVGKLLPQYPECASEADLLRQATLIGLYVLAAQATGQPAHGGYRPDELVALLKYRVLPAIDFLFEHDAYPALYRGQLASGGSEETAAPDAASVPGTQIVTEAAEDLSGLGTGFMDE